MYLNFREPDMLTDGEQLNRWIAKDEWTAHHAVSAEWWMPQKDLEGNTIGGCRSFAVEDDKGKILFYLKLENVMRCYIQFPPAEERDKMRTAAALKGSLLLFASGAKANGYGELIFESKSQGLINLFTNPKLENLSFKAAENNFLVRL
jgi:hypothetical protein